MELYKGLVLLAAGVPSMPELTAHSRADPYSRHGKDAERAQRRRRRDAKWSRGEAARTQRGPQRGRGTDASQNRREV